MCHLGAFTKDMYTNRIYMSGAFVYAIYYVYTNHIIEMWKNGRLPHGCKEWISQAVCQNCKGEPILWQIILSQVLCVWTLSMINVSGHMCVL